MTFYINEGYEMVMPALWVLFGIFAVITIIWGRKKSLSATENENG